MSVLTPCRLCLNNDNDGKDLFKCIEGGKSYAELVKDIFKVELMDMQTWPRRVCPQCVLIIQGIKELGEKIAASQDHLLRMIPGSSEKDLDQMDPLAIHPYLIDDSTPTLLRPKLEAGLSGGAELRNTSQEQSPLHASDIARPEKQCSTEVIEPDRMLLEAELERRNLLECLACRMETPSFVDLQEHSSRVHGRPGTINCCNEMFYGNDILAHMKYHLNEDAFKCPECGLRLISALKFKRHVRRRCPTNSLIASLHLQGHIDVNTLECFKCKMKYATILTLKRHLKTVCGRNIRIRRKPNKRRIAPNPCKAKAITVKLENPKRDPLKTQSGLSITYDTLKEELRKRNLLICSNCNVKEVSWDSLLSHMREKHGCRGFIFCCEVKFSFDDILDHMRFHLDKDAFECTDCGKQFLCKRELRYHLQKVCQMLPLNGNMAVEEEQGQNTPEEEEQEYELPTITDADLETELRERNLLVCHICTGETESFEKLMDHMQEAHNELGYIFCCSVKFLRETALEHVKFHINEDLFKCDVCGAMHTTQPELNAHKKRHHSDQERDLYPCETCGKKLTSQHGLMNHSKTHLAHREFDFVCEVCGKGYDIKSQLTKHSYTHRERKTEQCLICGKYVSMLKQHLSKMHSERKMEVCDICGFKTYWLDNHKRRIHSIRSLEFKCLVCSKSFGAASNLKRHMESHAGNRAKCQFCDHTASNRTNSRSHMKLKHPEEYEEYKAKNYEKRYAEPRVIE